MLLLHSPLEEGRQIEATTIGKEGMVGVYLGLAICFSRLTAVTVAPGEAVRVPVQHLREILEAGGPLDSLLRKYSGDFS